MSDVLFFRRKKYVKRIQNKDLATETTIPERFIAGATAGFISQTAVYPLDVNILSIVLSYY